MLCTILLLFFALLYYLIPYQYFFISLLASSQVTDLGFSNSFDAAEFLGVGLWFELGGTFRKKFATVSRHHFSPSSFSSSIWGTYARTLWEISNQF